ncbi:MAG: hypothetical protein ACYTEZ_03300 [Planctomycetota bacterium]|jgi:hypothetical protein
MRAWTLFSVSCALAALCLAAPGASAQDACGEEKAPAKEEKEGDHGSGGDADVKKAARTMEAWAKSIGKFVADVRLTDADIQSFLKHYESFSNLHSDEEDEEFEKRVMKEGRVDFDVLLKDSTYQAWVRKNGLDAKVWLQKAMRMLGIQMRGDMAKNLAEAEKQLPEQLKQIEASRAQMGEAMYQQVKKTLERSQAALKQYREAVKHLPQATEDEKKLLKKHRKAIRKVIEEEEEEEEEFPESED